jgi:uncharacterized protein
LYVPANSQSQTGIILLSPGIKNRVAPHRLYVKMARQFCDLGFTVLRFDPEGLGDSEGNIDETYTADLYGSIQRGRFVEDTKSAMDWMSKNTLASQFVLGGLCGGALTGLLTAAQDKRVTGVLSLGMPVTIESSDGNRSRFMTESELARLKGGYFRRLTSLRSWLRFLSFRSDYRVMLRSMMAGKKKSDKGESQLKPGDETDNFNPLFLSSWKEVVSTGQKILMIFSEMDRHHWDFKEKFQDQYQTDLEKDRSMYRIHIIKNANHILSFPEWQKEMMDLCIDWLENHFIKNR